MTWEEYSAAVVAGAKEQLQGYSWYRGVCVDGLDWHFEKGSSVEDAIETAVDLTIIWDAPWDFVLALAAGES